MNPKFSIITNVHNKQDFVCKCLYTLFHQTFNDIEIIIIDDGSTDNSYQIIKEFLQDKNNTNNKNYKFVKNEKILGIFESRRQGVLLSSGEYIMYVDSDDWIDLSLCKELHSILEKEEFDFIQFSSLFYYEKNETKKNILEFKDSKILDQNIFKTFFVTNEISNKKDEVWFWQVWGKCFNKKIINNFFNFIPNFNISYTEDFLQFFFITFFSKKSICKNTSSKYFYRVSNQCHSSRERTLNYELGDYSNDWIIVVNFLNNFIKNNKILKKYKKIKAYEVFKNNPLNTISDLYKRSIKDFEKSCNEIHNVYKKIKTPYIFTNILLNLSKITQLFLFKLCSFIFKITFFILKKNK